MSQEGVGTLYALLHPRRAALPDGAARGRDLAGSARVPSSEVYKPGYELIFCAFTSSTMDFKYACTMARYSAGTILQLTLLEGFQLDELSLYPREHEVHRVFAGRGGLPKHVPPKRKHPA